MASLKRLDKGKAVIDSNFFQFEKATNLSLKKKLGQKIVQLVTSFSFLIKF